LIRLIVATLGPTPPPYKPLPDFLRPGSDMRFSPRLPPLSKLASIFVLIWIPIDVAPSWQRMRRTFCARWACCP
jgi:hypothetical protein